MIRYLLTRNDMSIAQQIVQCSHVCSIIEPHLNKEVEGRINLCLLSVETGEDLENVRNSLIKEGIRFETYYDKAYHGYNPTAIISEPINKNDTTKRSLFKKFKLYR